VHGFIEYFCTNFKPVKAGGAGMAQGWRSGESTRLPPISPGFDSRTRRHM